MNKQQQLAAVINLSEHDTDKLVRHMPLQVRRNPEMADQFLRSLDASIRGNTNLMELTKSAAGMGEIMRAASKAAQQGLPLGSHAYLVPYGDNVEMITEYRGMLDIWRRDPDYTVTAPELVYSNDEYYAEKGVDGDKLVNRQKFVAKISGDRGEFLGGFMRWTFRDKADYKWVPAEYINAIKKQVLARKKSNKPTPWEKHFNEMALKTVVKYCARYGNTNPNMVAVIQQDDRAEMRIYDIDEQPVRQDKEPLSGTPIDLDAGGFGDSDAPAAIEAEPAPKRKRKAAKKPETIGEEIEQAEGVAEGKPKEDFF